MIKGKDVHLGMYKNVQCTSSSFMKSGAKAKEVAGAEPQAAAAVIPAPGSPAPSRDVEGILHTPFWSYKYINKETLHTQNNICPSPIGRGLLRGLGG